MTITADTPTVATATVATPITRTLAARAAAAVGGILDRMRSRHQTRRLLLLGDEHFRDMGVTRADVRRALDAD